METGWTPWGHQVPVINSVAKCQVATAPSAVKLRLTLTPTTV